MNVYLFDNHPKSIMAISVDLCLMSGKRVSLEVEADASVESLKQRAQSALETGKGRLLNSSGEVLDGATSVQKASIQSGDLLTLHVKQTQVVATRKGDSEASAFAAILSDGSVVTWGEGASSKGDRKAFAKLKNVEQIQASEKAFAAILGDGSVVTWGHPKFGGQTGALYKELSKDVRQIQGGCRAFAAIKADGSVVTWGYPDAGGDSSGVQDQLKNVQKIQANLAAFAAIRTDGSVVTWGASPYGGDSTEVQEQLKDVRQIQASLGAFAAVLGDGSVVTWGIDAYGGHCSVHEQLTDVKQVQATESAFAAILGNGSVVTWGDTA